MRNLNLLLCIFLSASLSVLPTGCTDSYDYPLIDLPGHSDGPSDDADSNDPLPEPEIPEPDPEVPEPDVAVPEGSYNPDGNLYRIYKSVNIQTELAAQEYIIDNRWVPVGINREYTPCIDERNLYEGNHSYRFELRGQEDNSLDGYGGGTKGRSEFSWCYATAADITDKQALANSQILKTVYYAGKGYCRQGARVRYTFAILLPESLSPDADAIFAQWHGMPSRTLTMNPEGIIKEMTEAEFIGLEQTMIIDKDLGYERLPDGKKGKPNGWKFEQGGYPPMSFGISNGWFYIQANSDRSWLTDKSIRCNINPLTSETGDYNEAGAGPGSSYGLKRATLAYKRPLADFPKGTWVTFQILVDWTDYGQESQTANGGNLDVVMMWNEEGKGYKEHIVDNMDVLIGRNDHKGYYFKFGIYRAGGSTVPVSWNLAGYEEESLN